MVAWGPSEILDPIEEPTLGFPDEFAEEGWVLVSLERDVLLRWHTVLVDGRAPDLTWAYGVPRTPAVPLQTSG